MKPDPPSIAPTAASRQEELLRTMRSLGSVLVAYSGGADSAYLAWAAHKALGDRMLAVIADSPSLPRHELSTALDLAASAGFMVRVVHTAELASEAYIRNHADRCYHCKDELFSTMEQVRVELGFQTIAYGMNADDSQEFRPGQRAAALHHAVAPLAQAGLTKAEIRTLAREAGLAVWDKPASACLASRIAYGQPVTAAALRQVEQAENALRALGLRQFRVRHHGEIARIEIARGEMASILKLTVLDHIAAAVRACGFVFVTLDVDGYRSGSMNGLLPVEVLSKAQK